MACGLPIISTDCQREILAPDRDVNFQLKELAEYGILTPIKNLDKLQEAMNLMMKVYEKNIKTKSK